MVPRDPVDLVKPYPVKNNPNHIRSKPMN
jgi:hypothetical protein